MYVFCYLNIDNDEFLCPLSITMRMSKKKNIHHRRYPSRPSNDSIQVSDYMQSRQKLRLRKNIIRLVVIGSLLGALWLGVTFDTEQTRITSLQNLTIGTPTIAYPSSMVIPFTIAYQNELSCRFIGTVKIGSESFDVAFTFTENVFAFNTTVRNITIQEAITNGKLDIIVDGTMTVTSKLNPLFSEDRAIKCNTSLPFTKQLTWTLIEYEHGIYKDLRINVTSALTVNYPITGFHGVLAISYNMIYYKSPTGDIPNVPYSVMNVTLNRTNTASTILSSFASEPYTDSLYSDTWGEDLWLWIYYYHNNNHTSRPSMRFTQIELRVGDWIIPFADNTIEISCGYVLVNA